MANSQLIARTVATAGSISGGAVLTLAGKTKTTRQGLEIVEPLLGLVACTVTPHSTPTEDDIGRVRRYLTRLTRRYGTLKRALDALAVGRRRHGAVCSERSAAWLEAMSVSHAAVEPTLRRHATLHHALRDWINERQEELPILIAAYERWLDGELTDFDDEEEFAGAAPGSFMGDWERYEEPAADAQPAVESLGSPRKHDNEDVELLWLTVFEDKRPTEHPGERELNREQIAAIDRLTASRDPYHRAVAAVAARDFGKADSFMPHLDQHTDPETLAMLRGHRYEMEGRYDEALEQYRLARPDLDDAAAQRAIAVCLLRSRKGSAKARFGEAVRTLRGLLRTLPDDSIDAARANALLAFALVQAPTRSRADNIRQAILLYERALEVVRRDEAPQWWAELNHYLGCAILDCPATKRETAIPRAIDCFNNALQVWTRTAAPAHWASVQYSLGIAYERNPVGEKADNIERAVGCLTAALAVRTREANPIGWARAQNALGNAWMGFPEGDARQNTERAIAANTAALEVWALESRRSEWASTQNALATAWTVLPTPSVQERVDNLERAVACFRSTLDIRTKERTPGEWASTQHNLGNALLMLGQSGESGSPDAHAIRQAIMCFNNALTVRTKDRVPAEWARTQAALGTALAAMPSRQHNTLATQAIEHLAAAERVFRRTGDERNAAVVAKRIASLREELGGGEVGLVDDEHADTPRIEVKRARAASPERAAESAD
jgi:tetratricopeptide (TPR) repeat protein